MNFEKPDLFMITDVGELLSAVVELLLILAALIAFIYLILGGIQWITSGGDKAGMEAARNKITHAVVGLIIVGAAWAIMTLVQQFLGVDIIGNTNLEIPRPYN
jgi:TRAP-type C4-dicarboxylate transport system permease small subunit